MLWKTNISLTSHHIFAGFERQNNATGSDGVLSLHQKAVCFETGFSFAVFFQDKRSRVCGTGTSFHRRCEHSRKERRPCSTVWNVLRALSQGGALDTQNGSCMASQRQQFEWSV